MAVKFPQYDNEILGGSDTWDNDLAAQILLQDYFEQSAPVANYIVSANTTGTFANTGLSSVEDTRLRELNPTTNYATATTFSATSWVSGDTETSVIRFNGLNTLGVTSVTGAEIGFYLDNINGFTNYELRESLRAWVEAQATWNIFSTGNNWQTAGGVGALDAGGTALNTQGNSTAGTWIVFTGTAIDALVQSWCTGGANNGVLLRPANLTAFNTTSIGCTSSNGTDGLRPYLRFDGTGGSAIINSVGASKSGATASASAVKIATSVGASKVGAKSSASGTKIAVNTGASKLGSTGNAIGQVGTVTSSIGASNQGAKNTSSGFKIATGIGASRAGVDNTASGTKIAQSISTSKVGVDSSVAGTKIALSQSTAKQGATASASGTKTAISTSSAKVGVDNSASGTKTTQSTGASKTGSTGNAIGQVGTVTSSIGASNQGATASASGTKTATSTSSAKVGVDNSASGTKLATGVGASKVGAKGSAAGVAIVVTSSIGASKVGAKASASGTKTAPSVGAGKQATSSTSNGFKIAVGVGACRAGVKSSPSSELLVPAIKKQINFRGPEWITVSQGFWNS